jgi:hypothetical protein
MPELASKALDAWRISLPEEIGKRGEPSRPERVGKQEADNDDRCRVGKWIDEGAAQPVLVHRAARGNDGLGAEIRGEHGEGDQPGAKPTASQDVVVGAGDAPGDPGADGELNQYICDDCKENSIHAFPHSPKCKQSFAALRKPSSSRKRSPPPPGEKTAHGRSPRLRNRHASLPLFALFVCFGSHMSKSRADTLYGGQAGRAGA